MTVALLAKWGDQPPGTLINSDTVTEAAMIAAKVATATLAGAVAWTPNIGNLGLPSKSPIILTQSAIPAIIAPGSGAAGLQWSGTDGTFTISPALPSYTFPQEAFMYFPANQIAGTSNPAGWYYAILSGTGGGKVYNNPYVSGAPKDAVPVTPSAFSGVTNAAWLTQTTGLLAFGPIATMPGGALGKNGRLRTTAICSTTNNANNKNLSARIGGSTYGAVTWTTSVAGRAMFDMHNRNSLSSQIGSNYIGLGAGVVSIIAVNTAIDQPIDMTLSIATNTDYHILESFAVELVQG